MVGISFFIFPTESDLKPDSPAFFYLFDSRRAMTFLPNIVENKLSVFLIGGGVGVYIDGTIGAPDFFYFRNGSVLPGHFRTLLYKRSPF